MSKSDWRRCEAAFKKVKARLDPNSFSKDELKAGLNPEQQQKLEEMYGDFSQHFPLIQENRGQLQGRPSSMN